MKTKTSGACTLHLRFYEELNDFLPAERRKTQFAQVFPAGITVAKALTVLGVPSRATDLILLNGESAGLARKVKDGDRISFYPVFEAFDITPVQRIRRRALRRTRFVAGPRLRRLTRLLRHIGYDVIQKDEKHAAKFAESERRILITQDAAMTQKAGLARVISIAGSKPREQLLEVLNRLQLLPAQLSPRGSVQNAHRQGPKAPRRRRTSE